MRCPGSGPTEYREADIQILDSIDVARRRPGMYIGWTDARGLHWMLFNLVDDSLGEVRRGYGQEVRVALHMDGSAEVADDGIPFPVTPIQRVEPGLEAVFTRLFCGSVPGPDERYWLNYFVANALSAELSVRVRNPGGVYLHTFRRGQTHAALQSGNTSDDRGLTVRFRPDPDIFGAAQFDPELIRTRLRQCAFLHSGVRISFTNEVNGTRETFEYGDGISAYVEHLNAGRTAVHENVIRFDGAAEGVEYEIAFQWCAEDEVGRLSFANGYATTNGGEHEAGFRTGVTRAVNGYLRANRPDVGPPESGDAHGGLVAVVSVWLDQPYFAGATRDRLNNPEVRRVVASGTERFLREYLDENPALAGAIMERVIAEKVPRETHRAARRKRT